MYRRTAIGLGFLIAEVEKYFKIFVTKVFFKRLEKGLFLRKIDNPRSLSKLIL